MDAPAIRPAMFEMGERLAKAGYYVLLPDMFWRAGPYEPIDIRTITSDEQRRAVFGKLMGSTSPEKQMSDTGAFLAWLDKQPKAKADKVGVTGYCMGGGIALRAAGTFPDKIAAAASFHGGNLATDDEKSPHRLAPRIKAKVLIAGADEDRGFPPEQSERLKAALDEAHVRNEVSIWPGAKHGWVPTDMPVHDPEAAERHWKELIKLFDETLKEKVAA
jgi:carboxymethylenebutenolidase